MTVPSLPLQGIRVLDLSRILAGPHAAQLLGDLGAEVIKVERPGRGDEARLFGPPFLRDAAGQATGESAFYLSANRNKRSITVDIAQAAGQDLIRRLATVSDVLIENFKVGDLKRYGLDYDSLSALNPRLIYCSVTGFGQTGPYAARPGYDTLFQALSGFMSVTGHADGAPGAGPMRAGPSIADICAGQNAFAAILAALYQRDARGGTGQHLDVALLDSMIAAIAHFGTHWLVAGEVPVRRGSEGNGGLPSRVYSCSDGDIVLIAGNDGQYRRLCEALGRPDLGRDARFATNADRVRNRQAMNAELEALFQARTVAAVLAALHAAEVPVAPIYDMRQVFEDPQVQARGLAVPVAHTLTPDRSVELVGHPVKYSGTPVDHYTAPPVAGEHTDGVLRDVLGLDAAAIQTLRATGVV